MIQTYKGDLLDCQRGFIIHGCNALGVMGSGVARGVKARFPQAFNVYQASFMMPTVKPKVGDLTIVQVAPELFIVNAITQDSVGTGIQVSYLGIELAFGKLQEVADMFDPRQVLPICFPLIGAGRGGGDWATIAQLIEQPLWQGRKLLLHVVDAEPTYCA